MLQASQQDVDQPLGGILDMFGCWSLTKSFVTDPVIGCASAGACLTTLSGCVLFASSLCRPVLIAGVGNSHYRYVLTLTHNGDYDCSDPASVIAVLGRCTCPCTLFHTRCTFLIVPLLVY